MSKLNAIPTNIITGFLGVGKTTAILHLLKHKPAGERWAVLVNEFGEVGIDGGFLRGRGNEEDGLFVHEVPGGCMCCTAGLPMQVALNKLLKQARPERLLIEPTGLGHPGEVLNTLAGEHYADVLDLRATLTLVDARKSRDNRYTSHPTFNQQLAIADVIVANKADQYEPEDFPALMDHLHNGIGSGDKPVFRVSDGALEPAWLEAAHGQPLDDPIHRDHAPLTSVPEAPKMPAEGYLSVDNEGEGFYSRGWVFEANRVFDAGKLRALLRNIDAERIKGVFVTDLGVTAYNKADNVLTEAGLDDTLDSRIECISADRDALENLENKLLDCVINR